MGLFSRKPKYPLIQANDLETALRQYAKYYEDLVNEVIYYSEHGWYVPQDFFEFIVPMVDAIWQAIEHAGNRNAVLYLVLMPILRLCEGALTIPNVPSNLQSKYRSIISTLRSSFDYDW